MSGPAFGAPGPAPAAALFARARRATGGAYLRAEAAFREAGAAALAWLDSAPRVEDPVDPLQAAVFRALLSGGAATGDDALRYLHGIGEDQREMPNPVPLPGRVAEKLRFHFGGAPAAFLALRLAREPGWAGWMAEGVAEYLALAADPRTLPALARVVATTRDATLRNAARRAIGAFEPGSAVTAALNEAIFQARRAPRAVEEG
ncbi:hypothetical protein [Longimicrobium sp.]|uniref:hypothetical protein n=1 Tax=Longimicrobium sp. TaxID=2029185 RepID=UPI002BA3E262|nr:hypothetical protein [Longimicrobium sp.]HSU14587.1 hypothetical protein [Longimicrobium sp.]